MEKSGSLLKTRAAFPRWPLTAARVTFPWVRLVSCAVPPLSDCCDGARLSAAPAHD